MKDSLSQVLLTLPSLRAIKALGHPLMMQFELWLLDGPDPNVAMKRQTNALVGLLSVPLSLHISDSGVAVLASGVYCFRNVLEGFAAAKVELHVIAAAEDAALLRAVLPGSPDHETLSVRCEASDLVGDPIDPIGRCVQVQLEADHDTDVPALTMNHEFKVHILSVQQLPAGKDGVQHSPVARYLKCGLSLCYLMWYGYARPALCTCGCLGHSEWCRYKFPCDDQALYTQDIPVERAHEFEDATFALHRIGLPQGAPILQHLVQGSGSDMQEPACLEFEVYDCFEEGTDKDDIVCFKGKFPVSRVLDAASVEKADKVLSCASSVVATELFCCK